MVESDRGRRPRWRVAGKKLRVAADEMAKKIHQKRRGEGAAPDHFERCHFDIQLELDDAVMLRPISGVHFSASKAK